MISFIRDDLQFFELIVLNSDGSGTVDIAKSDIDGAKTVDPLTPGTCAAGPTCRHYVFPNLRSGTGTTAIEVLDDETADVVSIETGVDTVVQKCGNDACTTPGSKIDSYDMRLTKQPTGDVEVAILTDGMVDVTMINGLPITPSQYKVIGGLIARQLFIGNITIGANGLTITRANGSDLGNFVDEGFLRGDRIRVHIQGLGDFDAQIADTPTGVTEKVLTLAIALPNSIWGHTTTQLKKNDTISYLTLEGEWTGAVTFVNTSGANPKGGWQLVRNDKTSWLGDGFLEGQWIEICQGTIDGSGNCVGVSRRMKIAVLRGDNKTKDEKLELRSYVDLDGFFHLVDDLTGVFTNGQVTVRRIAPVATFTNKNWFDSQEIVLTADVGYVVPISRQGVKIFPVQKHGLYKLQGPLAVEGGVTGADRSLNLGLKLPGEKDGPLFKIGTQPPESKQIDVLNIFNNGSKADDTGTMTSTTLSGFGLAKDLDFGPTYSSGNPQTFGEPAIFPGGIGFGTVQFVDGKFDTNGAKSTIEVVNFLGGIGNDRIDVQGTIDPDDPRQADRLRSSSRSTRRPASTWCGRSRSTGRPRASWSARRSTSPASPRPGSWSASATMF